MNGASGDRGAAARERVRPFASLHPWEPHFLELPEGALHYLDEGPREAEPVLCVHGNPTWCFYWRALVSALRGRRRVLAPDHLGCGLSDRPPHARYDLAMAHEAAGETDKALHLFTDLDGQDANFRDVAAKVRDLRAALR